MSEKSAPGPAPQRRAQRFCCGYLSIVARRKGECEECAVEIERGDRCWWHPVIHSLRCRDWGCRPTYETFKDNEIVVWFVKEGQFEPWYMALHDAEDDGDRAVGVAWLAGEEPGYEPLDEVSGEILEASSPSKGANGGREAARGEDERETSFLCSSRSEDAPSARKLTSKDELLARPFESILADLQPTMEYHVHEAVRKSAGRFSRDDLRGVAYLKLVESMESFLGSGSFGAFLDVVIPNALIDYARRELPHDRNVVSFDEDGRGEGIEADPTEDWINSMEIRDCFATTPNAGLLVLGGMGFRASELGSKAVIDMRRSRARTTLAEMLRTRGL